MLGKWSSVTPLRAGYLLVTGWYYCIGNRRQLVILAVFDESGLRERVVAGNPTIVDVEKLLVGGCTYAGSGCHFVVNLDDVERVEKLIEG